MPRVWLKHGHFLIGFFNKGNYGNFSFLAPKLLGEWWLLSKWKFYFIICSNSKQLSRTNLQIDKCSRFLIFQAGVDENGEIQYLNIVYYQDNGCSKNETISPITAHHFPNCYESKRWHIEASSVITDVPSTTWCRAPGLYNYIFSQGDWNSYFIINIHILLLFIACFFSRKRGNIIVCNCFLPKICRQNIEDRWIYFNIMIHCFIL